MAKPPPPCSPGWLSQMFTTLPIIVALLQTLVVLPGHSQNDPTFLWCPTDANYTTTSQFKRNLDRLLANLSTVPTTASLGHFRGASAGGPDAAYGLVQCRGDVLGADCATCLNHTASQVVPRCPLQRIAAIRYENCLLRYSDRPLLGVMENRFRIKAWNVQNTTDRALFDQRLMDLVTEITSEAAAGSSRFAVGKTNYSEMGDIYALAQCTRDLPERSCEQCLWDLTGNLPRGQIGGAVVSASCFLRFEIAPFFSLSVIPPPPPPPPLQPAPGPPPESSSATPPPTDGGGNGEGKKSNVPKMPIIAIVSAVAALIFLFGMIVCLKMRRPMQRAQNGIHKQSTRSSESLLFDFETLKTATGNFSNANKLGEGGFGPVYKGVLPDGQEIAVKKLSRGSGQGLAELRNEVALVARLQHRNLVRLLGFCLEQEEKMLIYEYLPKRSLDKFLFDPIKRLLLDWESRYKLIEGIARGLVYLHEDSRLRIIHRDLKASNILLDEHMNPKISDFGLAKLFGVDETHGNTSRIAGTLGYMAPEYAIHGQFSTKLDVFSFGVLALEIVTGRRNGSFQDQYGMNATDHLLSYVWHHWNVGAPLRVLDQTVEKYQSHEVLRCIHIALLCIQEDPSKRPNMSAVALMLSSASMTVPAPSRPAFVIGGTETSTHDSDDVRPSGSGSTRPKKKGPRRKMDHHGVHSTNEATISDLDPR